MEDDRILRQPEVSKVTGLPRSSLYRRLREGTFPLPVQTGPNSVGWFASEVQEWLRTRPRATVRVHAGEERYGPSTATVAKGNNP